MIQAMDSASDTSKKSGDKNGKSDKEPTLWERERISQISFPFVLDSLKYDGLNLMHWSQYTELILNGRGLKDHLTIQSVQVIQATRCGSKKIPSFMLGS